MNLLELPEEILILIIQKSDTKSIYNMHQTCTRFKNIISMRGTVKECSFSKNTLATVKTFSTDFFHDIAPHLQELNLCGAPDVRKSYLVPALKKLKSLVTLDISFTQLNILDFLDLYKACPTIVNISLNFMISKSGLTKLSDESIQECQNAFKNMNNIHLIGSVTNLLYSKIGLLLLQDAKLDTLKYTIAESDRMHTIYVPQQAEFAEMVSFKSFFLHFLDWSTIYAFFGSFFKLPVLSIIDPTSVETATVIKRNLEEYCIHATPLLDKYFQETFEIDPEKIFVTEYKDVIIGNAVMMIWNKDCNDFNTEFFNNLTKKVHDFFPCDCNLYLDSSVPTKYDWFYLTPEAPETPENDVQKPLLRKRKRTALPTITLDYDELFKTKHHFKLSIIFDAEIKNPVAFSPNSEYLSKLTYLSLTGSAKFTSEFYNIIFKYCINLVTINVEAPAVSPSVKPICKAIHQAKCLKNIRLTDRMLDFKLLLTSFAKCKTLENICLSEESGVETVDLGDVSVLFKPCPNLYSIFIVAPLSDTVKNKKLSAWNGAKLKHNVPHLNIMIHSKTEMNKMFYSYDPFISVFNLNSLKQI